jgi:hypothetical protein
LTLSFDIELFLKATDHAARAKSHFVLHRVGYD